MTHTRTTIRRRTLIFYDEAGDADGRIGGHLLRSESTADEAFSSELARTICVVRSVPIPRRA